jgi:hypothetical protein
VREPSPRALALLSLGARAGFALALALLVLAVSRWPPVHARPPLEVEAQTLAAPTLALAILAALTGRERRPRPWRLVLAALLGATVGLLAVTALRGPAGLPAEVSSPEGPLGTTPPGAVAVVGRDLRAFPGVRRFMLRWRGELRVPASGRYRLHVEGRGRATVSLGGRVRFEAAGDPLRASTDAGLTRGPTPLEVLFEHRGPGPRLRLGWTRPDGGTETIPPRFLGPPLAERVWRLTDALALIVAALLGLLAFLAPWESPGRPPSPEPVTRREIGLSVAGYLLLLAVMSWPLVLDPVHTGPIDRRDGRLNAWILAWAGPTLWSEPARVFQAPAFHPLPDALAFSENLLLPAALVAPLQSIGPVFSYNVVLIGGLLLSGLGTQLLVRRVSGDRLAAFVAGAYFAAGPHRWTRLAHLHAQVTVFLPLALLLLDRFWERRTLLRALAVGLAVALQGLASVYLGAIAATAVLVAVLVAIYGGLKARELLRLACGFALAAVLLWPVVVPYLRMRAFQGMEFTLEAVSAFATTVPSYLAAGTSLWGPLSNRLLEPDRVREALFPGLAVLALGVAGLASAPRRYRAVAVLASAAAILVSLGPETALYRFLHEHVVLVRGLRALSRFSLVPVLALSVLAGLALSGRRRAAAVLALGLMMAESASLPLGLGRYDGPARADRWLVGWEGAVVHLPFAEDDTLFMLEGLAHRRPLVNGESAFLPRPFDRAMELLAGPLGEEALRFLRAVGVRHVVSRLPTGLPDIAVFGEDEERVAEVPAGEAAMVVSGGVPAPTAWTRDGVVADLGEARSVDRVVFELSDAPWVALPRVEVSLDGLVWETVEARASLADATLSLYRDPRHGRGEVRFTPLLTRFVRLDARLPIRPGVVAVP